MVERRDFLKLSVATGIAAAGIGVSNLAVAATPSMKGIVYTKEDPGKWAMKVSSHAPVVSRSGLKVTITTKHGMSAEHFIVRHTLVLADGSVAGAKTFTPADPMAESVLMLPPGYEGKFYATSFCNLHDMWLTESP